MQNQLIETRIQVNRKNNNLVYPITQNLIPHSDRPCRYDLSKDIEIWTHSNQKNGNISGYIVFTQLKNRGNPKYLDINDAFSIMSGGQLLFRYVFGVGTTVVLWGSSGKDSSGYFHVPVLIESKTGLSVETRWLGCIWRPEYKSPIFLENI